MKEVYKILSHTRAEELEKEVNALVYYSTGKWVPLGGLVIQPNGVLLQPMGLKE